MNIFSCKPLFKKLLIVIAVVFSNTLSATDVKTELTDADYKKSHAERTIEAEELIYSWQGKSDPLRRAANLIESVIKEDNDYVPALIQLSRLARKNSGKKGVAYAKKLLDQAEKLEPDNHDLIAQKLYIAAVIDRDHIKTLDLVNKATELNVKDPWIHVSHAKIFMHRYQYQKADKILQRAVELGPGDTKKQRGGYIYALQDQCSIAYNQSDNERMLKLAESATSAANSDNAWVWGNFANLIYRANMLDEGIEYYRKALSIMNYGRARKGLGLALHAKAAKLSIEGKKQESQETFEEALTYFDNPEQVTHQFANTDLDYLVKPYIDLFVVPMRVLH